MSPAVNRGSSAAVGDSQLHSLGTPAPAGIFGPSTPAPMTPASAEPGIVPQLQYFKTHFIEKKNSAKLKN